MDDKRIWGLMASGSWATLVKDVYANTQREVVNFEYADCDSEASLCVDDEKWFTTSNVAPESLELHCDPQRNRERKFAKLLGLYLADCVGRGEVDGLVIVASPRTLGDLRRVYAPQVSVRIVRQISQTCILKRESDVLDYFDSYYSKPRIVN